MGIRIDRMGHSINNSQVFECLKQHQQQQKKDLENLVATQLVHMYIVNTINLKKQNKNYLNYFLFIHCCCCCCSSLMVPHRKNRHHWEKSWETFQPNFSMCTNLNRKQAKSWLVAVSLVNSLRTQERKKEKEREKSQIGPINVPMRKNILLYKKEWKNKTK